MTMAEIPLKRSTEDRFMDETRRSGRGGSGDKGGAGLVSINAIRCVEVIGVDANYDYENV